MEFLLLQLLQYPILLKFLFRNSISIPLREILFLVPQAKQY